MHDAEDAVKNLHMEDLSIVVKVRNFADVMGYVGYISGREEDRRKLYVSDVYELVRRKDNKQFGYSIISGSYHVHVTEEINAFDKLRFESEFQVLSPGGAISYIETANLSDNVEAAIEVIKYIYNHIMYAELNTKSDYCQECGYDGEIQIVENEDGKLVWECPNCGNRDRTKMNIARRTCGYIGLQDFNQGRTQEIKERYVHLGGD